MIEGDLDRSPQENHLFGRGPAKEKATETLPTGFPFSKIETLRVQLKPNSCAVLAFGPGGGKRSEDQPRLPFAGDPGGLAAQRNGSGELSHLAADRLTLAVINSGSIDRIEVKASKFGLDRVVPQDDQSVFDAFGLNGVPGIVEIDVDGKLSRPAALGVDAVREVVLGVSPSRPTNESSWRRDQLHSQRGDPATPVADAIGPYRSRLLEDAADFSEALLALAEANAKGSAGFNEPSPQDAVVLHVLVHWRRDAQHALSRVNAVASGAPGRGSRRSG